MKKVIKNIVIKIKYNKYQIFKFINIFYYLIYNKYINNKKNNNE